MLLVAVDVEVTGPVDDDCETTDRLEDDDVLTADEVLEAWSPVVEDSELELCEVVELLPEDNEVEDEVAIAPVLDVVEDVTDEKL